MDHDSANDAGLSTLLLGAVMYGDMIGESAGQMFLAPGVTGVEENGGITLRREEYPGLAHIHAESPAAAAVRQLLTLPRGVPVPLSSLGEDAPAVD